MKAFAIAFVAMMLVIPAAAAQTPVIGVQAHLSSCQLYDGGGEFLSIWVVQESGPAVAAARFRVDVDGWSATYIGAWYPVAYVVDPDPLAGATLGLPSCGGPPNVLARLDFLSVVQSPECALEISVVADPSAASGEIEAFDCDDNVVFGQTGATVVVNPDPDTCPCVSWQPVNTEPSTWGRVKALYR